jgi:hypothetical protein
MSSFALLNTAGVASTSVEEFRLRRLLKGEILTQTHDSPGWAGAVTAEMYVPLGRAHVWRQVTDYSRWVEYFPDMVRSEVLGSEQGDRKRLYQVACRNFMILTARVEIYLQVLEQSRRPGENRIQFCMEQGDFTDFMADLKLRDCEAGTLLTYSVKATPTIPVPGMLIQQAMKRDLPTNMETMRRQICCA